MLRGFFIFQVNPTIIAKIIAITLVCPTLVIGDASLLGVEYNFIKGERIDSPNIDSHNHHVEQQKIDTASHHHDVTHVSKARVEEETNYNDVEYESDNFEPASSNDYYDDNADR